MEEWKAVNGYEGCYEVSNTNSVLTEDEAQSIVDIYAEGGISMRAVSRMFPQVSFTTVMKIIKGTKWPHLKRPIYK